METTSSSASEEPMNNSQFHANQSPPQLAILDFFFPGFSVFSTAFQKYLGIDLNVYIPLVILCGGATFAWRYFSDYVWEKIDAYLMSTVEVRTDDEIYNILMSWVASQRFAKNSRRFVVNTNLNSRSWFLWRWDHDDDDDDNNSGDMATEHSPRKKPLAYTPSFGSHTFWYRGHLLLFKRSQNQQQASYLVVSEREEISVSCFGRNPWILKELLQEARSEYLKKDSQKTMIYRGSTRAGTAEPTWQRCMARTSRPFSTVILNEKTKKELVEDVADYLSPATRKWYSNRGIPWRRGYLLSGPPGTGKSSLSLALAGFFKMRIYIVSLNSISANEENLASLFAELPRRCVVLLEDIDTAGLTHTREESSLADSSYSKEGPAEMVPGQITPGVAVNAAAPPSRLSLSGLLNILDGVASQEGRVLIMTTNHIEKLDKALIRPGRVDMVVKFTMADEEIVGAIFRAIFAPLEGDDEEEPQAKPVVEDTDTGSAGLAEEEVNRTTETRAHIDKLSRQFVIKIPAHEFSPAEIQGFLMKHKRSAEAAIAGADDWVVQTRKEKKEKELKVAEERRKAEAREKEAEKSKNEKEAKPDGSGTGTGTGTDSGTPAMVTVTSTVEDGLAEEEPPAVDGQVESGDKEGNRKRDSGYGTPVET
ncbi:mitochondrial chaperone BCS1 [Colletotrichum sojae]|uniref:Mitochondrial chaperone BCS1 n=1 Tax=Colletotrichum sojae TaxID=2175907 RepID=A0A8H6MJL9_9PEZI|nr:mitochondrial chaperone BCS1 [Colletotrichum sojae]